MSSPPPHQQPVDLSDREAAALEAYATAHGLTPEQAATQLAQHTLSARYRIKAQPARVIPFRRRQ